ncbi:uncharacterized protein LOC116345075 [Contarinia nasturtii]|uniref:uncharacterized protein LOC116345075 n=1 Tax=Contarinia nasturtii TaxID=265458 RepID=UPI0012D3BB1A|nr:uncharacterized protein LOC116345075 [Contarinia nasturtii]
MFDECALSHRVKVIETVASSSSNNSPELTYANILKGTSPQEQPNLLFSVKKPETNIEINKMTNGIGCITSNALRNAKQQDRLIVGLTQAIKTLSNDPEDTMFCILAQPSPGDSAAHMQVILLEAFCYENGIYTIKVDDMEKLSTIVGAPKLENCVLMQRFKHESPDNNQPLKLKFFDLEERLIDHCEDYWDAQHKPIIRLPDE